MSARQARVPFLLAAALTCAASALAAAPPQGACLATEEFKLAHPTPASFDQMGHSVAVDGDTAAVGVPGDAAAGLVDVGSVLVFARSGASWTLQQTLTASDGAEQDFFGWSVALSGDTLLVGAPGENGSGAYAFTRSGTTWTEQAKILSCDTDCGKLGWSVAIDGDTAAVGAPEDSTAASFGGAVHVLIRSGTSWGTQAVLTASDASAYDWLGSSVALDGDTLLAGAPTFSDSWLQSTSGAAYVFQRSGFSWSEQAKLTPTDGMVDDEFGFSVALSGDRALVGARLSDHGNGAFDAMRALAFDPLTSTLYGFDSEAASALVSVDRSSGASTLLLTTLYSIEGAAFDPGTGTLYGTNGTFDTLVRLNLATGQPSTPGALGFSSVKGLAFDPNTNTLYGSDTQTDQLLVVNQISGTASAVGALGFGAVRGLAFDPSTSTLYGGDAASDALITIDTNTGAGTLVGPLGVADIGGLAYDTGTGTLYGTDTATAGLLAIDTTTGAASPIGTLSGPHVSAGSAYVFARSGTVWSEEALLTSADAEAGDELGSAAALAGGTALVAAWGEADGGLVDAGAAYVFESTAAGWLERLKLRASDAQDGAQLGKAAALDGDTALIGAYFDDAPAESSGAAYEFRIPQPAVSYCTAGTSASGCSATLGAAGVASASAASGFSLSAAGVEGAKDGLFFFGTGGRQANPWGNGSSLQCVAPPVKRASLLAGSGSAGQCNGAFSQDLNALWCPGCPKPSKNPGAGATVQAQLWYRDPQNTGNQTTSLSDALEFCVSP